MKLLRFLVLLPALLLVFSCTEKITEYIQLAEPVISPEAGTYYSGQAITITCAEPNVNIHYTGDGSEPTEQSPLYDENDPPTIPDFFPPNAMSATLKAKAFKPGFDPSNSVEAAYTVQYYQTVSMPTFVPLSGNIDTSTEITIYCSTTDAAVRYTLDGSEPTHSSILYTDPFTISQTGEITVKARGFKPIYNPSEIAVATYNVSGK